MSFGARNKRSVFFLSRLKLQESKKTDELRASDHSVVVFSKAVMLPNAFTVSFYPHMTGAAVKTFLISNMLVDQRFSNFFATEPF